MDKVICVFKKIWNFWLDFFFLVGNKLNIVNIVLFVCKSGNKKD